MALPHLADSRSMAVHADELEERGDSRAELVRAQAAGHSGQELITQHWSEWVGELSPKTTLLRWERGYIVEAALAEAPPSGELSELLGRPAARFLRRLAVGPRARVTLEGLEALRELIWLPHDIAQPAPLSGGLETLTLDLQGHAPDLRMLSAARFPRLTRLNTRCLAPSEEALFRALAKVSWWPTLTKWTHRARTLEGLQALRVCGPLLSRGGRGLRVFCEASVLARVPDELRRALPHAEFTLLPVPVQPRDPDDSHAPAEISVTPVEAPMDFRTLPPRTDTPEPSTQNTGDTDHRYVGSGVPFSDLAWDDRRYARCGWCHSALTHCIWEQDWSSWAENETTRYARWEYECPACGLFTHSRCTRTS